LLLLLQAAPHPAAAAAVLVLQQTSFASLQEVPEAPQDQHRYQQQSPPF
jgi:hypothetical protein